MNEVCNKDITKFVILSTQRSGSTFFRLYLNSHPSIRLSDEIFVQHDYQFDGFNHFLTQYPFLHFLKNRTYMKSKTAKSLNKAIFMCVPFPVTRKFLKNFFYNPGHSAPLDKINARPEYIPNMHFKKEKARGFKVMYNQLKWVLFLKQWIIENDISVIHLIRKNLLRVYISLERLKKNHIPAHIINNIAAEPVYISKTRLLAFILKVKRERDYYRKKFSRVPYMEVFFEDFLLNMNREKARILSFLGIEDAEMVIPELKPYSSVNIRNDIINYNEIVSFLNERGYGSFLNSG